MQLGNHKTEKKRCVICAAGPVGNADKLRPLIHEDDWVIAADGGMNLLERLGVKPALIVADFDSASRSQADILDVPIAVLPVKKDDTDTMAAAKIAVDKGYHEVLLLGATGGRLDHTLSNLSVVLFLIKNGVRTILADENNQLEMVMPGRYVVGPIKGMHLSLLPYAGDVEGITVKNVEYELNNATLKTDFPLGVSNEFIDLPVEISFEKGILLIILSKD